MPDVPSPDPSGDAGARAGSGRPRRLLPWIAGGALVVAVPVVLYGVGVAAAGDRIPQGTTVAGVDIGGQTPDEARATLNQQVAPRVDEPLTVQAGEGTTTLVPVKAGLALDVDATVDAAAGGRGPREVIAGLFGNAGEVAPVVTVDDARLERSATTVARRLDRPVRDGGIRFVGERAVAVAPVDGVAIDPDDVATAVAAAAVAEDRTVAVEATSTEAAIDRAEVARALEDIGEPAVSAPVTVRVTRAGSSIDESVVVPVARFTPYLKVRVVDGALTLVVNGPGLRRELADDLGDLETPARDATFRISGGKPVVVPSRAGRSVSPEELADEFAAAALEDGARLAEVRLTASEPALTTAQARQLGVVERMATFTQNFPYAPYRYQNIGQAAERVNGTLLLPGETFSMNDTVLERTPENGYTEGFVIRDGRLTEDLGGGVSTITTAVWHSAFFAGLERVEQRAHSFYISRYQAGLEATVSWGSLDLKFRNDSGNGVFITAERGRNFVTVTMWGTKKYDIDDVSSPRTNVKPFGTIYDASPTCTPQQGVEGFTIVVTRVFKQNGVEVKREPLRTTYRPAANVICRPAPKASPEPSASPKPSSSPKPTSR